MPKRATGAVKTVPKPRRSASVPDEEAVRRRAYELYLERGGSPGDPSEDWLRAEREILSRQKGKRSSK